MRPAFIIDDWSAFAPGLAEREQWLAWVRDPFLPQGEATPALAEMPPMQRRRVDALGRMALQVAWRCQPDASVPMPTVFASRHGELVRSSRMLQDLARDEPLSPTHFGLSTHNAIGAQYGIARGLRDGQSAIAAGRASAEAAFVEALGLLADGHEAVLVVVYDAPLPEGYAGWADEPQAAFAWAVRLRSGGEGTGGITLEALPAPSGAACDDGAALPHALSVLRFLLGADTRFEHEAGGCRWRWRRHD